MRIPTESVVRVGGALVIGAVLLVGALSMRSFPEEATSPAAATVAARDVRTVIESIDTDGDGYPDWEEMLRGTDPYTHTTFMPTATSTDSEYTPPNTVTEKFSERFLEDLVRTSAGRELTEEEQVAFVTESISSLVAEVAIKLYTRANILVVGDNTLADHRAYGNAVADILLRNSIQNENELVIMERAALNDNPSELAALEPIAQAYAGMVADMLKLATPSGFAAEHVDLLNMLALIESDIRAMRETEKDPLNALVHTQRYIDDATGLYTALNNIRTKLESAGIAYTSGEPGMFLFSLRP